MVVVREPKEALEELLFSWHSEAMEHLLYIRGECDWAMSEADEDSYQPIGLIRSRIQTVVETQSIALRRRIEDNAYLAFLLLDHWEYRDECDCL